MGAVNAAPSSQHERDARHHSALHRRRWKNVIIRLAPLALLVLLGQACSSSTSPGEIIEYTFDEDLQGWSKGTTSNGWGTVQWVQHSGRIVKLDGVGGPGQPNAWIFKQLAIPAGARTLTFRASAHNRAGADTDMRVRAEVGGASTTLIDWKRLAGIEGSMTFQNQSANIAALAGQTVVLYFEQRDNGPGSHEQLYLDDIVIR